MGEGGNASKLLASDVASQSCIARLMQTLKMSHARMEALRQQRDKMDARHSTSLLPLAPATVSGVDTQSGVKVLLLRIPSVRRLVYCLL